jgi:hypothetical protein
MHETRVAGYDSQKRASGIEKVSFRSGWMLLLGSTLKHYSHRRKAENLLDEEGLARGCVPVGCEVLIENYTSRGAHGSGRKPLSTPTDPKPKPGLWQ